MPIENVNDLLYKAPFRRIRPNPIVWTGVQSFDGANVQVPMSSATYDNISQDQFLQEYYPTGHNILNPAYYPDRIKTDDAGKSYIHFVQRFCAPWQQVIVTKHLAHLCGNPISFVNSNPEMANNQESDMIAFKQGWIKKNMEVAWYEAAKSVKVVGDSAICFYLDKGQLGWRVFSYLSNEVLYPQYDPRTGKLKTFSRRYKQYDEEGVNVINEFVDVYDDTNVTTYKRELSGGVVMSTLKKIFGRSGWTVAGRNPHGFDRVPVAYKRCNDGACWSMVQDNIEKYELAVSQLLENNQSYAFRILFLQGESVSVQTDGLGQPTAITGDKDSNAKFLDKADASETFKTALEIILQNILTGSFTVLPPDVKSGSNLPGVTIKILYSPAVENGMADAKEFNKFIDDTVELFKYGYGIEIGKTAAFSKLDVRGSIDVYVHQNLAEIIQNINTSVVSGTLSKETAAEIHPLASSNEKDRIKAEAEEKAKAEAAAKLPANPNADGMNDTNLQRQAIAERQTV